MVDPVELVKNRRELVEEMHDKYGYLFCQKCGRNQCGMKFEVHHIIFRSEAPNHPMLHKKINLIIAGTECHTEGPDSFHKNKSSRNQLVKERKLDEIFGISI